MSAAEEIFTELINYLGTRKAVPTVKTANIPEFVQSTPGVIYKNPHASMEQVMRELAGITVDELTAQVQVAPKNSQFTSAFTKIAPAETHMDALASIIAKTVPRPVGTSTAATEMMILLDLANRSFPTKSTK